MEILAVSSRSLSGEGRATRSIGPGVCCIGLFGWVGRSVDSTWPGSDGRYAMFVSGPSCVVGLSSASVALIGQGIGSGPILFSACDAFFNGLEGHPRAIPVVSLCITLEMRWILPVGTLG